MGEIKTESNNEELKTLILNASDMYKLDQNNYKIYFNFSLLTLIAIIIIVILCYKIYKEFGNVFYKKLLNLANISNNELEQQIKNLKEEITVLRSQMVNKDDLGIKNLKEEITVLRSQMVNKDDLGIKNLKEEIDILRAQMVNKNDLRISVKLLAGKVIILTVSKNDTIKTLKSQFQEKENIPVEEQHLYLDGKLLDDNLTIEQSGLKESSDVFLVEDKNNMLGIVSNNDKVYIANSLEKNLGKKIKELLYSARKDGDNANTFHQKCDNKGELLYVILTTNNSTFAIYVSKPIFSDNQTRTDSIQMIISPANNFSIKSKNDRATYQNNSGQGAHFHCMQINAPFFSSTCTDIQSCSDFELPCYPSGNSTYQIKELEVYSVE